MGMGMGRKRWTEPSVKCVAVEAATREVGWLIQRCGDVCIILYCGIVVCREMDEMFVCTSKNM